MACSCQSLSLIQQRVVQFVPQPECRCVIEAMLAVVSGFSKFVALWRAEVDPVRLPVIERRIASAARSPPVASFYVGRVLRL